MNSELFDFLDASAYTEVSGAISPLKFLIRDFLAWLDDESKALHWLQNRRIERALTRDGFPIGSVIALGARPDQVDQYYVGNLQGPHSRFISVRPLVLDPDLQLLLPSDLTPTEIYKLQAPSAHRITSCRR